MKRRDLIKKIEQQGCYFLRHGSNHDIFINPYMNRQTAIPRHNGNKREFSSNDL